MRDVGGVVGKPAVVAPPPDEDPWRHHTFNRRVMSMPANEDPSDSSADSVKATQLAARVTSIRKQTLTDPNARHAAIVQLLNENLPVVTAAAAPAGPVNSSNDPEPSLRRPTWTQCVGMSVEAVSLRIKDGALRRAIIIAVNIENLSKVRFPLVHKSVGGYYDTPCLATQCFTQRRLTP